MGRAIGLAICLIVFHLIFAILFLAVGGSCTTHDCGLNELGNGILIGTGVGMMGTYLFAVPFGLLVLTKVYPLY